MPFIEIAQTKSKDKAIKNLEMSTKKFQCLIHVAFLGLKMSVGTLWIYNTDLSCISNLDMEFQVFIHGVNVVEYILDDPWNDAHAIRIVQVPLNDRTNTHWIAMMMCDDLRYSKCTDSPD